MQTLYKQLVATDSWLLSKREFNCVFNTEKGIMPVILIPLLENCPDCKNTLKTDTRPSLINIFFIDGQKTGHCYHKKCATCKLLVYNTFNKKTNEARIFHKSANDQEVFLLSAKTAVTKLLLRQITAMIEVTAVSFQGLSDSYLAMTDCIFDKQRIEEVYFISKLLDVYNSFDITLEVMYDADSCRKDLERLSKEAVEHMLSISTEYEDHQCGVAGCREGFIMADGIEKVSVYCIIYYNRHNALLSCTLPLLRTSYDPFA